MYISSSKSFPKYFLIQNYKTGGPNVTHVACARPTISSSVLTVWRPRFSIDTAASQVHWARTCPESFHCLHNLSNSIWTNGSAEENVSSTWFTKRMSRIEEKYFVSQSLWPRFLHPQNNILLSRGWKPIKFHLWEFGFPVKRVQRGGASFAG